MEGATIALAIATFILGAIAVWNIVNTNRITKEQGRPYIVLKGIRKSSYYAFEILNVGKTAAKEVSVTIYRLENERKETYLDEVISYLPPGRNIYIEDKKKEHGPLYKVELYYKPDWWKLRRYRNEYTLHLESLFRRKPIGEPY